MSHTATKILILLAGLVLLITGVSAANPVYQIETNYLSEDTIAGSGYYILNGNNLTLPLNITYINGDNNITRLLVETNITQDDTRITDLEYKYTFIKPGLFAGPITGEEWLYQFAGGSSNGFNGVNAEALVLNITNLPYSEDPYSVDMNVYTGSGNIHYAEKIIPVLGGVRVYYLYPGITDTNEERNPKWNLTNPLEVTTVLLSGNVPAGEYTIPWETKTVSRGPDGNFTLFITNTNTTASVKKLNGDDWVDAVASRVSNVDVVNKHLIINIADSDANADGYKIVFEGKRLGDVDDYVLHGKIVNIADVDLILHVSVSQNPYTYIAENCAVYGDVTNDGVIDVVDAEYVYYYTQKGVERSSNVQ